MESSLKGVFCTRKRGSAEHAEVSRGHIIREVKNEDEKPSETWSVYKTGI